MIQKGHTHEMTPVSATERSGDGALVVHLRCNAPVVVVDGWPRPTCTLEQELVFDAEDRCLSIRMRFNGVWMDALDLLRVLPIGLKECPDCGGEEMLVRCETCHDLRVVGEDGVPPPVPNLRVAKV